MKRRCGMRQRRRTRQRHPAQHQAFQAAAARTVVREPGMVMAVTVVPVGLMSAGFGLSLQGEVHPRQVEWRGKGQQQDKAKTKPLPPGTLRLPPNPVHAGSLDETAQVPPSVEYRSVESPVDDRVISP